MKIWRRTRIYFKNFLKSIVLVMNKLIGFLCTSLNFIAINRLWKSLSNWLMRSPSDCWSLIVSYWAGPLLVNNSRIQRNWVLTSLQRTAPIPRECTKGWKTSSLSEAVPVAKEMVWEVLGQLWSKPSNLKSQTDVPNEYSGIEQSLSQKEQNFKVDPK